MTDDVTDGATDDGTDGSSGDAGGLPPGIELAWGLRDRPARGPRRGLTLERVVAAGLAVAIGEGLGALSMGRIAKELGVGTMSLYRYVSSKDELLILMCDTALGAPPEFAETGTEWRAGLTRWAVAVRTAYQKNLWALRVPISAPPLGPNNVAYFEAALRCLADTDLVEHQKLSVVLLVSGYVRNEATLMADLYISKEPIMPGYGQIIARVADSDRFPALNRAIASGSLDDDDDMTTEFDFGLQCILDGVDALIRSDVRPALPGG